MLYIYYVDTISYKWMAKLHNHIARDLGEHNQMSSKLTASFLTSNPSSAHISSWDSQGEVMAYGLQ